jgi:hypothetical protein
VEVVESERTSSKTCSHASEGTDLEHQAIAPAGDSRRTSRQARRPHGRCRPGCGPPFTASNPSHSLVNHDRQASS